MKTRFNAPYFAFKHFFVLTAFTLSAQIVTAQSVDSFAQHLQSQIEKTQSNFNMNLRTSSSQDILSKLKELHLLQDQNRKNPMAPKGGVDTGGGSLVLDNGTYHLLDLKLAGLGNSNKKSPFKLSLSRALQEFGFDSLDLSKTVLSQVIENKLSRIEKTSPVFTDRLRMALNGLHIYLTTRKFAQQDRNFFLPSNSDLTAKDVHTAAVYVLDFGTFISLEHINALSFEDQVGLIVHEALRHYQITYGGNLSNQQVQEITAAFLGSREKNIDALLGPEVAEMHLQKISLDLELLALLKQIQEKGLPKKIPALQKSMNAIDITDGDQRAEKISPILSSLIDYSQSQSASKSESEEALNLAAGLQDISHRSFLQELGENNFAFSAVATDLPATQNQVGLQLLLAKINDGGLRRMSSSQREQASRALNALLKSGLFKL